MSEKKVTVLKFGGSVLRDESDLPLAVHEIYGHWRRGAQVLAVVSAFGGTTDALLKKARSFGDDLHVGAIATLLLTGEATSAALLALALKKAGIPAKLMTPEQVGILTTGDPLDSEPVSANTGRIGEELENAVVIVSGFAGIDRFGDLTLLGRGGTDFTALFLARKLNAKCVLLKDVDGLYDKNPKLHYQRASRFQKASYATALQLGGELVQAKAVRFAEESHQEFRIAALATNYSTEVGDHADVSAGEAQTGDRRVRVALLGCGTVGGGVYERLAAMSDRFEIVGVTNLRPQRAITYGIAEGLLVGDPYELIERDCDVVIELIGGDEPARGLIERSLRLGRHVVTANKALLASDGYGFEDLAARKGISMRYSASVGGSLPALEAASRATEDSRPLSLTGIINGTTNFICDQLAAGKDFRSSVALAQKKGFAEADPTTDIDGTDAAQKLVLLTRAAFGVNLPLSWVRKQGIENLDHRTASTAYENGNIYRLVAEVYRSGDGLEASVRPVEVPRNHPFAKIKGAENCLLIETECGRKTFLQGRGAGRYATTESVIADLFDVRASVLESNAGVKNFVASGKGVSA